MMMIESCWRMNQKTKLSLKNTSSFIGGEKKGTLCVANLEAGKTTFEDENREREYEMRIND